MPFETICVLGLGYIGLPTASTFATHGLKVIGVDVNQRVVDVLQNGEIHIYEPGLRTIVQAAFRSGNLKVSDTPEPADAFIIAVPTPLVGDGDKKAEMSFVVSATEAIAPHLQAGNLVVLESTSPPRTTIDLVAPILESSGLKAGDDFHLAYTPERVLPGQILRELIENTRVIGGLTPACAQAGQELYAAFVKGDILLTDATTAEMVKLMENTYRDINIAIANEFARLAERFGVDVWRAIELANYHPRVGILRAGPGVGGHCISVDPWFLVEAAPDLTPLIKQARQVNDGQPRHVVDRLEQLTGGLKDKTIATLGLAYKPDVDDLRESPAVEVAALLAEAGANVRSFEPFALEEGNVSDLESALDGADVVLLLVDHQQFRQIDPGKLAELMPGRLAFDTRGVWNKADWEAAGFTLHTLGVS